MSTTVDEIRILLNELLVEEGPQGFLSNWPMTIINYEFTPTEIELPSIFEDVRDIVERLGMRRPTAAAVQREYRRALRDNEPSDHAAWAEMFIDYNEDMEHPYFRLNEDFAKYNPAKKIYERVELRYMCGTHPFFDEHRGDALRKLADYKSVVEFASSKMPTLRIEQFHGNVFGEYYYEAVKGKGIVKKEMSEDIHTIFRCKVAPENIPTPMWDRYLDATFEGKPDAKRLMVQVIGCIAFGLVPELQRAILLYGPGKTGKSTMLAIIDAMFDQDQVTSIDPFRWEDETAAAQMEASRCNIVGELPTRRKKLGPEFKSIIGGDPHYARKKYGHPFRFRNKAAHVFGSNHLPGSEEATSAFMRRWVIIPFDNVVEDVIVGLNRIIIETELPGVIYKAMLELHELLLESDTAVNLVPIEGELEIKENWATNIDPLLAALRDEHCCIIVPRDDNPTPPTRYQAYLHFCRFWKASGYREPPMVRQAFYANMQHGAGGEVGIKQGILDGNKVYYNLKLIVTEEEF